MTTNELIEALRSELFDDKYCISDFEECDVLAIKNSCEPFFWLINPCGTHLVYCGTTQINGMLATEMGRMRVFRDPRNSIASITYYKDSAYPTKVFYWDGLNLQRTSIEHCCIIWDRLSARSIARAREEHVDEWLNRNELLPVKFASKETEESYRKSLEYSNVLADESLTRCTERLTEHPRIAVDQYILISADFTKHGYCFSEIANGKCLISGGIIPNLDKAENRWQIHT